MAKIAVKQRRNFLEEVTHRLSSLSLTQRTAALLIKGEGGASCKPLLIPVDSFPLLDSLPPPSRLLHRSLPITSSPQNPSSSQSYLTPLSSCDSLPIQEVAAGN